MQQNSTNISELTPGNNDNRYLPTNPNKGIRKDSGNYSLDNSFPTPPISVNTNIQPSKKVEKSTDIISKAKEMAKNRELNMSKNNKRS